MSNHAQSIILSHKEAAKRATEYLDYARNLKLQQYEALELVARVLGVANWQTLNALAKQGKAPRMPTAAMTADSTVAPDSVDVRAQLMAEHYSVANGWKEHPFLLREDWLNIDAEVDDGFGYWRFVVRRLDEIKAIMPWDRGHIDDVLVARAGGIDIDFDFDSESWGVASAEDDEFLDLAGTKSEADAWQAASEAIGRRLAAYCQDNNLPWPCPWAEIPLETKLAKASGQAMFWAAQPKDIASNLEVLRPTPALPPPISRETLVAGGFVPTTKADAPGEYLVKTLRAYEMPYTVDHIVGTEGVTKNSVVIVEVDPDRNVRLAIGEDYEEAPVPIDSENGRGILRDAGLSV